MDEHHSFFSSYLTERQREVKQLLVEFILHTERGLINTTTTCNALHGTWHVENDGQIKLSPLIVFDAFDKFKIMVRLKVQDNNGDVSYFIQTKGVYGVLPKMFTILVGMGPEYPKVVNFVPDMSWKKIADELPNQVSTTIHFKIELPQSNISNLYSPECTFSNIWEEPGADITIEASDGQKKNVHKTVLLARSDVFRAMWRNDMLESKENHLKIPELDGDSLNSFVSYLYRGTIEDYNLNKCCLLLSIADKYNMTQLVTKCQNILQKKLSKYNAVYVFLYADLHNFQNLKARATECVLTNMEAIVLTNAWRETNNASFFKHIYQDLVKIENRVVTVNKITQSLQQTNHCLKIKFPIDAQHRSDRLYQMTVSPELGYGTFIFRVLETDTEYFKLSVCQCEYGGDYRYTNVKFSGKAICNKDNTPISWSPTTQVDPQVSEMLINQWYDIALFKIIKNQLTVTLKISYDVKYNPTNCTFTELLSDSSSADMTIESSDGVFRQVHKSVLTARNLQAMVNQCDSKDHLKLSDLSALALNELINFIYTVNSEELHIECCAELLAIAHKYDLPAMKYECEIKLKTLINSISALELHSLAVLNKASFLEQWVLDYVHLNKLEIIETENWQNFNNFDTIKKLIEHHIELKESCTMTTSI